MFVRESGALIDIYLRQKHKQRECTNKEMRHIERVLNITCKGLEGGGG